MEQEVSARKGKFVFIGLILILLIIGVSVSWFLIIKPAMTGEKTAAPVTPEVTPQNPVVPTAPATPTAPVMPVTPAVTAPELKIDDLKLCSAIDENWNCVENPTGTFKRGDVFYVYFIVKNLKSKNINETQTIGFLGDLEQHSPNGDLIENTKNFYIYGAEVDKEALYNQVMTTKMITEQIDVPGEYKFKITIRDAYSNSEDSIEGEYTEE